VNSSTERRDYYRINDTLGLSYVIIEDDGDTTSTGGDNWQTPVGELLADIDQQFNQASNTIWQENPTVAKALGLLNRKLTVIAAHALPQQQADTGSFDDTPVNISGSGVGFHCKEGFDAGVRLKLSLTLRPSNIRLDLTSSVTGCEQLSTMPDKPFWVRVIFDEGNEAAQEQLIQHIVQRQSAMIGKHNPLV